ncbi:MAG: phytanoyl-CoA dioxygenase family protein [Acidimicrobiales bacterium]|jgi:hypothetical protein|nr:phytanoyl-CoA dioxygenase family protein [Acidimicrobiales bacterium]
MSWTVDTRTRSAGAVPPVDAATFWDTEWRDALARNGPRAAADAARLALAPLAVTVDDRTWTLQRGDDTLEVVPGADPATPGVVLDADAFADLVAEQRTALGLLIAGRAGGDADATASFCDWDAVLRSAIDGRGVYQPGDVTLRALDGSPLDLEPRFRLGERPTEAGHFLAEAGFLLLSGVFDPDEIDTLDADLARAVDRAEPADGRSWWAATAAGERYPCRILDLAEQSDTLRDLLRDPRYLAIGDLLGEGHRPGDPFGEHFADPTAEGLVKKVDSVEGLVCLPWHKDCQRGGHSMFCSGITVGICLTPVDTAHGGLDVVAGSHRSNIAASQVGQGLGLPEVSLRAERGDLTLHMSCALHRSTHPTSAERRVVYTGFTLPPRPGDHHAGDAQARLRRERAAVGDPATASRATAPDDGEVTRR